MHHSSLCERMGWYFFLFEVCSFDLRQWKLFKASQSYLKGEKIVYVCVRVSKRVMKHDLGSLGAQKKAYRKIYSGEITLNPCISLSHQHFNTFFCVLLSRFSFLPLTTFHPLPSCPHLLKLQCARSNERRHIKLQLTCNRCSLLSGTEMLCSTSTYGWAELF